MDQEDIKDLFEEKYEDRIGMNYQEWLEQGPQNEAEAYARLQEIDDELTSTYEEWYEASGEKKDEMEENRDRLKAEYDLIEESFGLEAGDKGW